MGVNYHKISYNYTIKLPNLCEIKLKNLKKYMFNAIIKSNLSDQPSSSDLFIHCMRCSIDTF